MPSSEPMARNGHLGWVTICDQEIYSTLDFMFFSVTAAKIYTELEARTKRMMTIDSPIISTYQNLSILIIILSIVYRAIMI